ncbi:hypothetical protein Syun_028803 [Stephania yunnanensis]|uniref:Uncharacterized protein n=1 Tax=Stephania yunnanensis TaxID=152371 RepID=A0AAP0ECG7_9MAGN
MLLMLGFFFLINFTYVNLDVRLLLLLIKFVSVRLFESLSSCDCNSNCKNVEGV